MMSLSDRVPVLEAGSYHQKQSQRSTVMSPQNSMELSENQSGFTGLRGTNRHLQEGFYQPTVLHAREEILTGYILLLSQPLLSPLPYSPPSSERRTMGDKDQMDKRMMEEYPERIFHPIILPVECLSDIRR